MTNQFQQTSTHQDCTATQPTGKTKRLHLRTLTLATAVTLALAGCQTVDPYTGEQKTSNTAKGAGIGAIGGAIAKGILGLFVGAVILAVGYELFQAWLSPDDAEPDDERVAT